MRIDRADILERLYAWNPWWRGQRPNLPEFRRTVFSDIARELPGGKVQLLAGPRQTGKTVILRQLAVELHGRGVPPSSTLYLPLDEFEGELADGAISLRSILNVFSEEIARAPLATGEKYVFIDEAHVHGGWGREVKLLYDQSLPLRLAVSGSASAALLAEAASHLAGRCVEHHALPLSFGELLTARLPAPDLAGVRTASASLGGALISCLEGKTGPLAAATRRARSALAGLAPRLRADLHTYLRRGGFPEQAFKGLEDQEADALLHRILDRMIRRDFVDFFHIRDTKSMERLIRITAQNTGRILVERRLASDLGVAINTVRNHIGFLENVNVVFTARALRASAAGQARLPEKFFFVDPGLRNALAGYRPEDRGGLLESVVYGQLRSFLRRRRPAAEILYWRQGAREVDMVIREGRRCLAVEVHAGSAESGGLKRFLSEHRDASAVLVSGAPPEETARAGDVAVVPPEIILLAQP